MERFKTVKKLVKAPATTAGGPDPRDPKILGYDRQQHEGLGIVTQQAQTLDYASGGVDAVDLPRDRIITSMMLVADPYRHDVTTATITPVQDAADKILSGLTVAGGPTYIGLASTLAYLKHISALNKLTHGGTIQHDDLATAVGADNDSYQSWSLNFGVLNDYDPFDASAGIPAEDESNLVLTGTFGASDIIAATSANGTVDTSTTLYVVTWGVQGLSREYRARLPIPDFQATNVTSVTDPTDINLQTQRYLKRSTILNLAAAASNNEARNDSNITDFSVIFNKPTRSSFIDRMRWRVYKSIMQPYYRGVEVDADGSAAISPGNLAGVSVIDWRRITKNPFGLNLYPFQSGDVQLRFTMGTTTGSLHILNEYYSLPDPTVAEGWPAYRPQ